MRRPKYLLVFIGSALLLGCSGGSNSNSPTNNEPLEGVKTEEQMQEEFNKLISKSGCLYKFFSEESQREFDGETHKTIIEFTFTRRISIGDENYRVDSHLKRWSGKTLEIVEDQGSIKVKTTEGRISKSKLPLNFRPGKVWHGGNTELIPANNVTFAPGSFRVKFYNRDAEIARDIGFDSDVDLFLYEYGCNKESE